MYVFVKRVLLKDLVRLFLVILSMVQGKSNFNLKMLSLLLGVAQITLKMSKNSVKTTRKANFLR